jgi:transposase
VENRLHYLLEPDQLVEWLKTIPEVEKLTAYFLVAETGEVDRFRSPAKFVSYCGLCPTTHQSGAKTHHGPTRGGGRKLLKWALIEASHTAVRRDSYFAAVFHKLARKKGNSKAYVAVAHKMAKVVWKVLTERLPYIPKQKKTQVGSSVVLTVSAD